MSNKFDEFLSGIDGIKLENGSEKDIEKLKDIFSGNIPKELLETFIEHVPADDVEVGDFVFYGIDRIIEENKDYVPGANIYPFGLFTFASTFDGDVAFATDKEASEKLKLIEAERKREDEAEPFSDEDARKFAESFKWKFATTYAKTAPHISK